MGIDLITADSKESSPYSELLRVFIASADELTNDCVQLASTIHSVSKYHRFQQVEPIHWKTDIEAGSFNRTCIQDELNELIKDCQIVIVLFYSRVGKFTLEEYNFAKKLGKKFFVYFKTGFLPKSSKETESLNEVFKLMEFLNSENQTLLRKYETLPELANYIQQDINLFISRLHTYPVKKVPSELEIYLEKVKKVNLNQQASTSEIIISKTLNNLNEEQLINLLEQERVLAHFIGKEPVAIEDKLSGLGLLQNGKDLCKGTYLCLGKNIGDICRNAVHSMFFLFAGVDKVNPVLCEMVTGNLIEQYKQMIQHLKRNLYLVRNVYRDEPEDYEIPEIAFRELLANAFIHREYHGELFSTVQVELYRDRLEVKNPGNFPMEVQLETIGETEVSFLRNPEIARVFFLNHFVEAAGSGIKRIQQKLKEKGLKPALFESKNNNLVKVTVYKRVESQQSEFHPSGLLTLLPPTHQVPLLGRDDELLAITQLLRQSNHLLVHGLGGIGKTECCKQYFLLHYLEYDSAAWIDYHESLSQSFIAALAKVFNLSPEGEPEQLLTLLTEGLLKLGKNLLLVVDNIENPEDPHLNILRSLPATVLVNSRGLLPGFYSYQLDVMKSVACLELFYYFYKGKSDDHVVNAIIQLCGGHTLTVELLARTAHNAGLSANELLHLLQEKGFDLRQVVQEKVKTFWHNEKSLKPFYDHLQTLFEISGLSPTEEKVALNLSVLPSQLISRKDIKELLNLVSLDDVTSLINKGWLQADGESGAVLMHQIVREILRTGTRPDVLKCQNLIMALEKKLIINPGDNPLTKSCWVVFAAELLRHISANDQNLAALASNLSSVYTDMGLMEKALEFQLTANRIWETMLDANHPDLAASYNNLSAIYYSLGRLQLALEFQLKAVTIREVVLDANHPDLASSYNNLSQICQDMGYMEKALEFQLKDVYISQRVLDANHPDLAGTYNNLSSIYQSLGQPERALEYQLKTTKIWETVLDSNHPDLATAYNNLSMIYKSIGCIEKALEFQEKATRIFEAVLEANHPSLAASYNNLSTIYLDLDKPAEAHHFSKKAVQILKNMFPAGHPNLKVMEENLTMIEKKLKYAAKR